MNLKLKTALAASVFVLAAHATAQITFYEGEGFRGRTFTANSQVNNFQRVGFNDLSSSVIVTNGRWEVCDDANFGGRCVMLRKGSYDSLQGLGMTNRISSVRRVNRQDNYANEAPEPLPAPTYEYYRRPNERVSEAVVTSVRAVVGPPEQRCWVERQQVNSDANIGGAIIGGILGGVLGHQVGGGRGRDIATAGGAIAGAAIGNNQGGSGGTYDRNLRRCETTASTSPAYWDVTYNYRGIQHSVQMSSPPGRTIAVNMNGEPRQ